MATLVVDFAALDRLHSAASDGFQQMVSDWLAARADLQQQLTYLRTVVRTAHANHTSAVITNVNMWQV